MEKTTEKSISTENATEIELSDIGKMKRWEGRRMDFIILGLCKQGKAHYLLDMHEVVIGPGDVLIVSERNVIEHFNASADLQGPCMILSVRFFYEVIKSVSDVSALFLFSHNHPVMPLPKKEQKVFNEYLTLIRSKMTDETNRFRKDLVRTLILAMFYDLSNVVYQNQHHADRRYSRQDNIFTRFIRLVETHCKQERRVSWYAEQLCITPKYLSETIKQASRRTPNEWIDNYVTLELRLMLKNTTKSIKEIAEELNFPNQSFLGKYFKEHVGVSPTKYRQS